LGAGDHSEALTWVRKAADANDADGMFNVGWLYRTGSGVPKDDAQALAWYQKAAEAGNVFAMWHVGNMTEKGIGTAADRDAAIGWYRRAAALGEERSRKQLAALGVSN
jgi:TPR repeat protein